MKITRNSYDNDVFTSLLNNLNKDFIVEKRASENSNVVKQSEVEQSEFFTKVTADNLAPAYELEIDNIAQEVTFAADRSRLVVAQDDFARFAKSAIQNQWKGKKLQREAQKFCHQVGREVDGPQGIQRLSTKDLLENMSPHKIVSASYNPSTDSGINNSSTGKYLGCSKNPNTIWDTDALMKQASVALDGEKMLANKKAEAEKRENLKKAHWQELQDQSEAGNQVRNRILSASDGIGTNATDKPLPINAMGIFGDHKDFGNIPDRTMGEKLAKTNKERSQKREESRSDWDKTQAPKNTRSALDFLFDGLSG